MQIAGDIEQLVTELICMIDVVFLAEMCLNDSMARYVAVLPLVTLSVINISCVYSGLMVYLYCLTS